MQTITQVFAILSIILFNAYIIYILRKEMIEYQYALMLLGAGLAMLVFAAFPQALGAISYFLGIGVPLNLIYFGAILFILALIFQTIVALSRMRRSIYDLIQEVSILKLQIQKMKETSPQQEPDRQTSELDNTLKEYGANS